MKGFIEVTERDGYKTALAVDKIRCVYQMSDGTTCVELVENRRGERDTIHCLDTYKTISELIDAENR